MSVGAGTVIAAVVLSAACSTYRPFDTTAYLRDEFDKKLPAALEDRVEVPFELDEAHRRAVEQQIVRTSIERDRAALIESFIFSKLTGCAIRFRPRATPTAPSTRGRATASRSSTSSWASDVTWG
ncbi:MAG: hypothetical protein R2991_13290 [Thermoanaerobaculia bacterium]